MGDGPVVSKTSVRRTKAKISNIIYWSAYSEKQLELLHPFLALLVSRDYGMGGLVRHPLSVVRPWHRLSLKLWHVFLFRLGLLVPLGNPPDVLGIVEKLFFFF